MGLDRAKVLVRRLLAQENGVHAVLFYGVRGAGKTALTEALAEAWACRKPSADGACGECQACQATARGRNPDLLPIEPGGAGGLITVGQITESGESKKKEDAVPLRTFFRTPPLYSRHKVASILEAHRMNDAARNALLKTLEEPHDHARLILTTDSVARLPATIVSRCMAVACELPGREDLSGAFAEATASDIAAVQGVPGRLRTLLANPEPYRRVAAFAEGLRRRTRAEALVCSDELRAIGDLLERGDKSPLRSAQADILDLLAACLSRDPQVDPRWPQMIAAAHARIQQNGNAQIVLDALFAEMLA